MHPSEDLRVITVRPVLDEDRLKTFLMESEEKFKYLVQNLPGMIFLYDQYPDGTRKRHFYGQPLDQILGKMEGIKVKDDLENFFKMIPEEDEKQRAHRL